MKSKKIIKITALALAGVILTLLLIVSGYLIYVAAQYYRIEDNFTLEVHSSPTGVVKGDGEYTIVSYNLGFGAYSPDYAFFMDEGEMNDGTKTVGSHAKGASKADVEKNVKGQIGFAKKENADFYFFQEVDEDGDRSYHINMLTEIVSAMPAYAWTYAENFHTANLLYPFNDPIGCSNSGIVMMSKYKVESSVRRSFPVSSAFPDRFFDLDRCFSLNYLPIEGSTHKLVLLNLHMSAYDKGGQIRKLQLDMLNEVLKSERDKGNYVIAGGDFNHCLIADKFKSGNEALTYFKSEQKIPEWVKGSVLHNNELTPGFTIAAAINEGTCRGADMPYEAGVTYNTVIDGFIVSDNIEVVDERTVFADGAYMYSDHNPVKLTFKLK